MPKLIPFLVEQDNNRSEQDIDGAVGTIYKNLPTLLYRAVGAQSGFLSFHLKAAKIDPAEYITDDDQKRVTRLPRYAGAQQCS